MIEALTYDFMQRAFAAGIIVAIICALIGVFLVLRRMSLIGDGLAHITFGGVALGLYFGINPLLSALASSLASGFAIQALKNRAKLYGETAIAILFSAGLAVGVILISLRNGFSVDILSFLFGSILAVSNTDLLIIGALGLLVPCCVLLFYKEFVAITFDEETAKVSGVPVQFLNTLFIVLTAITVVSSLRIMGVLLVSSFLVLPCATSMQLAKSFKRLLLLSVVVAITSVIIGLFTSYTFNIAPGGSIVFISIILFLCSLLIKKFSDVRA